MSGVRVADVVPNAIGLQPLLADSPYGSKIARDLPIMKLPTLRDRLEAPCPPAIMACRPSGTNSPRCYRHDPPS